MDNIQRKTTYSGTKGSGRTTQLLTDVLALPDTERSKAVVIGSCNFHKGQLQRHFEKLISSTGPGGLATPNPAVQRPRFVTTFELNNIKAYENTYIFVDNADRLTAQQLKEIQEHAPRWMTWTETVQV